MVSHLFSLRVVLPGYVLSFTFQLSRTIWISVLCFDLVPHCRVRVKFWPINGI